jgi:hypothetical protein
LNLSLFSFIVWEGYLRYITTITLMVSSLTNLHRKFEIIKELWIFLTVICTHN